VGKYWRVLDLRFFRETISSLAGVSQQGHTDQLRSPEVRDAYAYANFEHLVMTKNEADARDRTRIRKYRKCMTLSLRPP
jgi:hypothetical protein